MPSRLAVFSVVPWAFLTVRDWALAAGHELALLVTLPLAAPAPGGGVATLPFSNTLVMVVPSVEACAPALSALEVDLGVVFTFRRVPDGIATIPRHGMVNLHPSLLPAYAGPNVFRSLYEGEPRLGATLHHLTQELDAGPILARASEATPEDVQPASALEAMCRAAAAALDEGVPRALAGDPGEDQGRSAPTRAADFGADEAVLHLGLTTQQFHCRFSALTLARLQPKLRLGNELRGVNAVRRLQGLVADKQGVITVAPRSAIVATLDGVLELDIDAPSFYSSSDLGPGVS
jgi:methionyl-tRNA formyltransferase